MSFLLTLSWAEDTRTELSSRVFSRVVSRSSRNTVSDLHHRTPFCSCLSTRLSSRRNRTIEGWGSRSTVNARSRRHRFGFSNSQSSATFNQWIGPNRTCSSRSILFQKRRQIVERIEEISRGAKIFFKEDNHQLTETNS